MILAPETLRSCGTLMQKVKLYQLRWNSTWLTVRKKKTLVKHASFVWRGDLNSWCYDGTKHPLLPPKFNMEPEKWWFPKGISFFQGGFMLYKFLGCKACTWFNTNPWFQTSPHVAKTCPWLRDSSWHQPWQFTVRRVWSGSPRECRWEKNIHPRRSRSGHLLRNEVFILICWLIVGGFRDFFGTDPKKNILYNLRTVFLAAPGCLKCQLWMRFCSLRQCGIDLDRYSIIKLLYLAKS